MMLAFWLVGAVSMVVDHLGAVFYPGATWMREVGRVAWPVFAMITGRSFVMVGDPWRLVVRLVCFGFLSWVPHAVAFGSWSSLNIFFTLALGGCWVTAVRAEYSEIVVRALLLGVLGTVYAPVEYGAKGVGLVVAWSLFWRFLVRVPWPAGGWSLFRWWFYPAHLAVLAVARLLLLFP